MRKLLASVLVALTAACAAPYTAPTPGALMNSVVKIEGSVAEGSGVVVGQSNDGHSAILTANHVIADNGDLKIGGVPVTVVATDKAHDLALLDFPGTLPSVDVLHGSALPGSPEVTIGFPLGLQLSATAGFMGEPNTKHPGIQGVSGSMWPGNSGGGVFVYQDGKWQLAGIADMIAMRGAGTPFERAYDTIGMCVSSDVIQTFLSHVA